MGTGVDDEKSSPTPSPLTFEISYTPYVEGIVEGGKTTQIVDATSNKIRVVLPNATNEVTFKVVPISKTGTRGKAKTIKKTIY